MADLETLTRLLVRGAASAREDARRVLDELVARGDLSREEALEIEAAVLDAVEANRRWLDERLVTPLRGVVTGAAQAIGRALAEAAPRGGSAAVADRLEALERRLARLEELLARRRGGAE
jgi:polyhydroxyalkanoate synthesis regulator phasin